MSVEAQRLANELKDHFTKKTQVFLPFSEATEDLTARQALHVPQERFNSIWSVVNHICYLSEAALLVIQGSDKQPETVGGATGGWHKPNHADDAAWQALRTRTLEMHERLTETIAALDDEQLHTVKAVWKRTPYQIAHGVLAHDSYHTCEIITLRHMQGLWTDS